MMLRCAFLALFSVSVGMVFGQSSDSLNPIKSANSVTIHLSDPVAESVEKFKKRNYSQTGVDGYRVQIFNAAGPESKDKANAAMRDFSQAFPDYPAYLTYQQPNFKVRCGDFRTKAEARKLLKLISYQYPGSFIVRDAVKVGLN
jgi:hypothetical protein